MRDDDIDDVLKRAARSSPEVDPGLLRRISGAIGPSLRPVRPLPPAWVWVAGLAAIAVGAASAGAILGGLHGIQAMSAPQISVVFPALVLLILLAAVVAAGEMVPGSRRRVSPRILLAVGCLMLTLMFAALFPRYRLERFWSQGFACLRAGLAQAVPVAVLSWLLLRRGFAVDSPAAGFAQGALAGLAGIGMLELHCANFDAPHLLVWHTAILPLTAATGGVLGLLARSRRRR